VQLDDAPEPGREHAFENLDAHKEGRRLDEA